MYHLDRDGYHLDKDWYFTGSVTTQVISVSKCLLLLTGNIILASSTWDWYLALWWSPTFVWSSCRLLPCRSIRKTNHFILLTPVSSLYSGKFFFPHQQPFDCREYEDNNLSDTPFLVECICLRSYEFWATIWWQLLGTSNFWNMYCRASHNPFIPDVTLEGLMETISVHPDKWSPIRKKNFPWTLLRLGFFENETPKGAV